MPKGESMPVSYLFLRMSVIEQEELQVIGLPVQDANIPTSQPFKLLTKNALNRHILLKFG